MNVIAQSYVLVHRVHVDKTDFSDFYQSAILMRSHNVGSLYQDPRRHCLPPFGQLLFIWSPSLSPTTAASVWAIFNLALLIVGIRVLRRIYGGLEIHRSLFSRTSIWAACLFLILAGGSLQVGQTSVLFAVFWLLYLSYSSSLIDFSAAACLAVPGAIKIYPLLLFSVPFYLRCKRQLAYGFLALILLVVAIPMAFYGPKAVGLTREFARHVIFAHHGRIQECMEADRAANASVDVILERYLTDNRLVLHKEPHFPHLNLSTDFAVGVAQVLRLLVLVTTAFVSFRWSRRKKVQRMPRYSSLLLLALWCAALYLMMPETKSRYAIYTFPAFLPLLEAAATAGAMGRRLRYAGICALIVTCLVLVVQLVPSVIRMSGIPLLAPLILWYACCDRLNKLPLQRS